MPGVTDSVWSAQGTTPGDIEAALRAMLKERHSENASYVPARTLNLVCVVDKQWSGEIANRLRHVGRSHAARTIVLRGRAAAARRSTRSRRSPPTSHPRPGEFALLRETVIVDVGEQHLAHLDTIVDPLVVTDLPTVVWAPHGHTRGGRGAAARSPRSCCSTPSTSPTCATRINRAMALLRDAYVVDLAWLRSTPWRERVAATFDPPHLRPDLRTISAVTVRHHPESAVAGVLLMGWLASRLDWRLSPLMARDGTLVGSAHARRQDVRLTLEPANDLMVRGLAGVTLETASGRHFDLDRGPGGLQAYYRNAKGEERRWVVLGASRGEAGILGEGIRQALLRDPTYAPSLEAACAVVG